MSDPAGSSAAPQPSASGPPNAGVSPAGAAGREKRAKLPRELADFLIEFSIALHKHAMYPGGHPTLVPAAGDVAQRLEALLLERGRLSLGVARDQLIIEGVATDPKNPVLKDLADRLHRHHLGAVSFSRGVSALEVEEALRLIANDADRGSEPIGLKRRAEIPRWPHLELFPLTFDRLELVGGPGETEGDGEGAEAGQSVTGGHGALLWIGLARAALAADDLHRPGEPERPPEPHAFRPEPAGGSGVPLSEAEIDAALSDVKAGAMEKQEAEPTAVARAIESHERGTAYDQVIVGYLLQIADELKTSGGAGAVALKKKMSRLITALDRDTLSRLIEMGGDTRQRRQFVLDASRGMAVDAVVELVQAASGTGAPISNAMMRMLRKLSLHAERGPAPRRAVAEAALRDQVAELVQGWALADPNPDGYATALQKMSMSSPVLVAAEEAAYAPEPSRILQMAIETGGVGRVLERAVGELVEGGRLGQVIEVLGRAPRQNEATELVRSRVQDPGMLRAALAAQPLDLEVVDQLVRALGPSAVEPMLDVVAESESRQVRRALIDRLTRMTPEWVGPHLPARLADERWYVIRNILFIAAELGGTAPAVDAAPLRQHADVRVRREALRVLFRDPGERARAIAAALTDEDPRVKRLALNAVSEGGCPEPTVPLLIALATDEDQDSELRIGAIRALGAQGGRLALDGLLKLTEIRRRSIMDFVAQAGASPEYLAAVAALGAYQGDARARERLAAIAAGRDAGAAKAAAAALRGR